jgi:hypothetical protein
MVGFQDFLTKPTWYACTWLSFNKDGLNILNWLVEEKIDKCFEKKHTRGPKKVVLSFEIKDERKQSKND